MMPIIRCLAEGVWLEDKDEIRAPRMKINQPTISLGRYTWDPTECISERGTCSGPEVSQNTNAFNHGSVAILPMRNGYPWPPTSRIKARLGRERTGWVNELPNVLWAHRTSLKQINGETPFSLTYESEAVIPAEIGMPTHRTMKIREDKNEDELRLNMDLLQERREAATIRKAKYKTKMEQYYNQKVRPVSFKPDECVFRRNEASRVEDQGKLGSKWEGPYRVMEVYQNGSYKLQIMGGKEVPRTRHAINLRMCYI
ncbi:reverse transcriptase domain-containing protein [Tanacetum coccineum]